MLSWPLSIARHQQQQWEQADATSSNTETQSIEIRHSEASEQFDQPAIQTKQQVPDVAWLGVELHVRQLDAREFVDGVWQALECDQRQMHRQFLLDWPRVHVTVNEERILLRAHLPGLARDYSLLSTNRVA